VKEQTPNPIRNPIPKLAGLAIIILGAGIALWPPLGLSFHWLPMSDFWQTFRDSLAATPL